MNLVPGDDAALIAASNLAANQRCVTDHGAMECNACECHEAVLAELERRHTQYDRASRRVCDLCGEPFTEAQITANGQIQIVGTDKSGWQRRAHLSCCVKEPPRA